MIRLGVTGTDTAVGKTFVSMLLAKMLRRRGRKLAVMKPAETGVTMDDPRSDAVRLLEAAGTGDPLESVRPLLFAEPLAPWVAASRGGTEIDLEALDGVFRRLTRGRDAVLVEGAGGLLVPLAPGVGYDRLFRRWALDLVVVAGNRLGAINHTLLTVRAAEAVGLRIAGVVLNTISAEPPRIAERTNLEALQELLAPIPVLRLPWLTRLDDEDDLVEIAEEQGFDVLLAERPGG